MQVQLGPIVTQAAGSVGGSTFQRGASGTQVRTRPIPRTRRTSYTNAERQLSQYLSRQWRSVSAANQAAWQVSADALTWENRFGETIRGLGYWLWLRCGFNRQLAGLSVVESAPTVAPTAAITGLSSAVNVAGNTFTLSWTSGNVPAAETWLVFATPRLSKGLAGPGSSFRFIRTIAAATASGVSIRNAYDARFTGIPSTSSKVWVRVVPMLTANGLTGAPQEVAVTIT